MLKKFDSPLKIASLVVGAVAFFIHNELQRRETEELVEKAVEKRFEAEKTALDRIDRG